MRVIKIDLFVRKISEKSNGGNVEHRRTKPIICQGKADAKGKEAVFLTKIFHCWRWFSLIKNSR